jgi:drug/metabolite transporter (DMT)-like permease
MPVSNLIACAIIVIISTHTYVLAIYITNFPIVMMVKSCNIISVVFVGIFCSRVRDKGLKLGNTKMIVALFITVGILMYNFGGNAKHAEKATDVLGVVLLVISLVADGFLPDFQAVIKSEYKPRPLEMFEQINKWVVILCWCYCIATGQLQSSYQFASKYPPFVKDMLLVSVLTSVGQIFVYRMIKQFKQHIVPFVITTRKIFTVVLSIVFWGHETTAMQITAIIIVFASASYEYLSEIYGEKKVDNHHDAIQVPDTEERVEMSEVNDRIDQRR